MKNNLGNSWNVSVIEDHKNSRARTVHAHTHKPKVFFLLIYEKRYHWYFIFWYSCLSLGLECVCAVVVAILGTTSNMAAQSFLYHQVRRGITTSHFSRQEGKKGGFLFALFLSRLDPHTWKNKIFRKQVPFPCDPSGSNQTNPLQHSPAQAKVFHFADWITLQAEERKRKKSFTKFERKKLPCRWCKISKEWRHHSWSGLNGFNKKREKMLMDEKEIDPHYRMNRYSSSSRLTHVRN